MNKREEVSNICRVALTRLENEKVNEYIDNLQKQLEEYQKALDETTSEKMDLENIIKEVREYISNTELGKGTEYYRIQILQILDKEK